MKNYTYIFALLCAPLLLINTTSGKMQNIVNQQATILQTELAKHFSSTKKKEEGSSFTFLKNHPIAILTGIIGIAGTACFAYAKYQESINADMTPPEEPQNQPSFKNKNKPKDNKKTTTDTTSTDTTDKNTKIDEETTKTEEKTISDWFKKEENATYVINKYIKKHCSKTEDFLVACNDQSFLKQALDKKDKKGGTILHWAARYRNINFLKQLLEKCANDNEKLEHLCKKETNKHGGRTPLHYIAAFYSEDLKNTLDDLFTNDENKIEAMQITDAKNRKVFQYYLMFAKEKNKLKLSKEEDKLKEEIESLKKELFCARH